jgi:hypothetical protein
MSIMPGMMQTNISQDDYTWAENARNHFPEITSHGYGLPDGCSNNWTSTLSDKDIEQIIAARDFLCGFKPLEQVSYGSRKSHGSPTAIELKSLLQKYSGIYVYEGDIILAASALGLPIRNHASCHAQIGVSRRQYKDLQKVVESSRKHSTR